MTGGGDCAGLNSAIKWVTLTALDPRLEKEQGTEFEVWGIKDGWKGLAFDEKDRDEYIERLTEDTVSHWDRYGGTNLGTSRYNPFNPKGNTSKLVLNNIGNLGLDSLIAVGGDDTLSVAAKLSREGINVIGIPKTIDKDLVGTDYSLGFVFALPAAILSAGFIEEIQEKKVVICPSCGHRIGGDTRKENDREPDEPKNPGAIICRAIFLVTRSTPERVLPSV